MWWLCSGVCAGVSEVSDVGMVRALQQGEQPWPLTASPEVLSVELNHNDRCIVIATDGLWDVMTSEQAVKLAMEYGTAREAARGLVDRALFWGSLDNVSVVVVFIAWDAQLEAAHATWLP